MRYLLTMVLFSGLASANSIIYVLNTGSSSNNSALTGQTMMQLMDDGTTELLLKDFQLTHSMIRQLIANLVIRAQAESAARAASDEKPNETPRTVVYNNTNLADALRFALISGGWDVCTMCPGAISSTGKSTSSPRQTGAPAGGSTAGGGTAGGSAAGGGTTAGSSNAGGSNPGPGLVSAQNVSQLDTANASIAAVTNNAGAVGGGSPTALGVFGDGTPSFGTEVSPNGAGVTDVGGAGGGFGLTADVPEPGTWTLVGAGLALAIARFRKSRSARDRR